LDHAYQANLRRAPADHVQGLHHPGKPVTLKLERSTDRFCLWSAAQIGLGRRLRGRRLRRYFTCSGRGVIPCGLRRGLLRDSYAALFAARRN
jgi:hypothetical protein